MFGDCEAEFLGCISCSGAEASPRINMPVQPGLTEISGIVCVTASHSGDWLHAIPSLFDNKELRIARRLRFGAPLCISHECVRSGTVEASLMLYQLNQLGSKAASDSTFKQLTLAGYKILVLYFVCKKGMENK